ncbi:MAG: protein-export chaperone SecB [Smithella sp.]
MGEPKEQLKLHPIQLIHLGVKEIYIKSHIAPDISIEAEADKCSLSVGGSKYIEEDKRIDVALKLEFGRKNNNDDEDAPFSLLVEIVGIFKVNDEKFQTKHIMHWARNNAPLILLPYLREHVFSITSRCGFKPILLPLLEVPTFKVGATPTPQG